MLPHMFTYIELPQAKLHRGNPECQWSDKLLEVESQHLYLGVQTNASLCLLTHGVPGLCDAHLPVTHRDRLLWKVSNIIITESQINTAMRKFYSDARHIPAGNTQSAPSPHKLSRLATRKIHKNERNIEQVYAAKNKDLLEFTKLKSSHIMRWGKHF